MWGRNGLLGLLCAGISLANAVNAGSKMVLVRSAFVPHASCSSAHMSSSGSPHSVFSNRAPLRGQRRTEFPLVATDGGHGGRGGVGVWGSGGGDGGGDGEEKRDGDIAALLKQYKLKAALGMMKDKYPALFNGVLAGLLWGTGDTVAQVAESQMSRSEQGLNVNRVGGAATHGVLVGGVMANLWYIFLDKVVSSRFIEGSIQFCSAKMGMEFFLWAPFNLFCFAVISEVADGRDWQKLKKELQETFVLTWIVDAGLQSPLDFINFRFVPPNLQALCACGISFAEAIALSLVNSHGGDAPPQEASSVLGRKSSLLIFKSLLRQLSADNFEDLETVLARGREEFESLDVAGKGYLTIPQLEAAVRMRGLVPGGCDDAVRSEVLRAVVRKVDKDGSGKVKLQNYLSFLRSFHDAGVRRSFMVDVIFNAFDTSGDRKLDLSELTNVVSALGDALSSRDMAAEIIRQCDSNKDGSISPEELKDLLLKTC